jgi:exocyst complex component 4
MSRQQAPFPTSSARRPRSPAQTNGYDAESTSFSSTRPLQISRPSRPHTPSNSSLMNGSPRGQGAVSPSGPSRPQRSELRSRQVSEYSNSDQTSGSSRPRRTADRESVSTTRSDASLGNAYRKRTGSPSTTTTRANPKSKGNAPVETSPISPSSMAAIMAFQNAGQRKRAQTNGSDDYEYEREKKREREQEMLMQQRIREKAPGRRPNGKARAGDIDGTSY